MEVDFGPVGSSPPCCALEERAPKRNPQADIHHGRGQAIRLSMLPVAMMVQIY